jgi:Na+/H+ antiporter NhaD/arsenite permease-like protein
MLSPSLSVIVGIVVVVYLFFRKCINQIRYKQAQKSKECLSPKRFKRYEPFLGLDLLYAMIKALREHQFLP